MVLSKGQRISLNFRSCSGVFQLKDIESEMKVNDFQLLIAEKTGIDPFLQVFMTGFPPTEVSIRQNLADRTRIGQLLHNGETIVLNRRARAPDPMIPNESEPLATMPVSFQSGQFPPFPSSEEDMSDHTNVSMGDANEHQLLSSAPQDVEFDMAIALSLEEVDQPPSTSIPSDEFEPGPIYSDRVDDGSYIVRRYVDSDNSCLFTAVAYLMDGNRLNGFDLRSVIAQVVASDRIAYNEAFLGRPNFEYCHWINNPQHWGGEIELNILSKYYKRQIAVYDIRTTNCYVYGRDAGFKDRVMLVYDGIHYDALARSLSPVSPESWDMRIYNPESPDGKMITRAADRLVRKLNATNQFTSLSTLRLRCDDCGTDLFGAKKVDEHIKLTDHARYSECP